MGSFKNSLNSLGLSLPNHANHLAGIYEANPAILKDAKDTAHCASVGNLFTALKSGNRAPGHSGPVRQFVLAPSHQRARCSNLLGGDINGMDRIVWWLHRGRIQLFIKIRTKLNCS
ncbi:hypothetical protein [Pelagibacterium nitratireducens]|uniref:hypothetical protein n=1 Tax=Pelagibacterium nitratireducens TaxID=1046114 RepID=UPI003BB174A6